MGRTGALWDWWPNYALANHRSAGPASGNHPLVGLDAIAPIRHLVVDEAESTRAKAASLPGQRHIPPAQVAAAGIDLASFRVVLLADSGRVILGRQVGNWGQPRAREGLLQIKLGPNASDPLNVVAVPLPFEEIFQVACDPAGCVALVLGDHGSRLAWVDFGRGTVTPPDGLELQSVGLRASGVAGWSDLFWFSAWHLDDQGEVTNERAWGLTPWGFWGGLSLEALRAEFGQLRSYFITGPTSGFFAVSGPGGTNEQLWSIVGTNRTRVDTADSFGGMHAINVRGAGGAGGA